MNNSSHKCTNKECDGIITYNEKIIDHKKALNETGGVIGTKECSKCGKKYTLIVTVGQVLIETDEDGEFVGELPKI
ncbi:Rev-Erb beta 2 [Bacillus paranthracis]|uniref:Rev-Erb beta 2 n=1 Tax=Bacillus cereus group TaxID=86661 RepID=UPI0014445A1C|nr:Rev-Erb beta 2 [Bacillus paranthracis]NKX27222.1 Rev-Erb beta 2 [Bacillus paranthracis]